MPLHSVTVSGGNGGFEASYTIESQKSWTLLASRQKNWLLRLTPIILGSQRLKWKPMPEDRIGIVIWAMIVISKRFGLVLPTVILLMPTFRALGKPLGIEKIRNFQTGFLNVIPLHSLSSKFITKPFGEAEYKAANTVPP